jgi:hypothetical protein
MASTLTRVNCFECRLLRHDGKTFRALSMSINRRFVIYPMAIVVEHASNIAYYVPAYASHRLLIQMLLASCAQFQENGFFFLSFTPNKHVAPFVFVEAFHELSNENDVDKKKEVMRKRQTNLLLIVAGVRW